jgi:hypothetical protein
MYVNSDHNSYEQDQNIEGNSSYSAIFWRWVNKKTWQALSLRDFGVYEELLQKIQI